MIANTEAEFTKIASLENTFEAQLVESFLTEQGIPHRIRSFHDTAYDGLFQVQKGWGAIFAPLTYEREILDILKSIRSSDYEMEDEL
ncbi:hypothetical protein ACFL9U_01785 [Thermodesulfobacteriota bacterium]